MYGLYGCSKQPPPLLPPLPQPLAPTPARCRHLLSHYRRRNRCRCHWNALLLLPAFPALASMQLQLLARPLTLPSMPLPQEAFLDFASMEALPLPLSRSMPLPPPLPPPLPLALPSMSVQLEAFLAFASAHPLPLARARSMPLPPPLPPTRPLTLPSMSVQLEASSLSLRRSRYRWHGLGRCNYRCPCPASAASTTASAAAWTTASATSTRSGVIIVHNDVVLACAFRFVLFSFIISFRLTIHSI